MPSPPGARPPSESWQWDPHPWAFTVRDDELANIRYRGRLVARSIRLVVRDCDWNTLSLQVDSVSVSGDQLEMAVHTNVDGADIVGRLTVDTAVGRLGSACIRAHLVSRSRFETNRTGLVVLHPPRLAGTALTVTTSNGDDLGTYFTEDISPHQIATDITALTWSDQGLRVRMGFEGDVFEMEDQRNWTDASYKTYSRPLSRGFPYTIEAGAFFEQAVTITAEAPTGGAPNPPPAIGEAVGANRIELGAVTDFPSLGVAASTAPEPIGGPPAPVTEPAWATTLVELDLRAPTSPSALARAAAGGRALDARVVLGQSDAHRLDGVVAELARHPLARVTAFWGDGDAALISDERATAALAQALHRAGLRTRVCGGVRSQFAELNREHHRLADDTAGIVFSVSPFVHGADTTQLVESVSVQRSVARQAVRIAGGRPVFIGPISLRPHVNAVATTAEPRSLRSDLAEGYGPALLGASDERQDWPLTAAWTVASAAAMAVAGVASLSYFEEWGPRGVRTHDGHPLPVLASLRALARWQGARVSTGGSDDGLVWVIAGADRNGGLAANLDTRERCVQIKGDNPDQVVRLAPASWVEFP